VNSVEPPALHDAAPPDHREPHFRLSPFSALRRVWVTGAICALTLLGYFGYPGHTYLQSDTQIYVPILEHLRDPAMLARDPLAAHPHTAYTLFDEVSLLLRWALQTGFEQALTIQQVASRAVMLLGVYWLAAAFGLSSRMSVLVAAIFSLGATILGPTVLVVEYEAIPRGIAFALLILSLGMLAQGRTWLSAAAATAALLYHPPTTWVYWPLFGALLLRRVMRGMDPDREARRGLMAGIGALALLFVLSRVQPGVMEPQVFFGKIDAAREVILRTRATYIWVSLWPKDVAGMYLVMWALAVLAWFRLRRYGSRATDWMLLGLPTLGALSIPLSWVLLEQMRWSLAPQWQPARAALFVTATLMLLASIAAAKAAERKNLIESLIWFVIALAPAVHPRVLELLRPEAPVVRARVFVICALAVLGLVTVFGERWSRMWSAIAVGAFALVAVRAIPEVGRVQNFPRAQNEYIENIALWARLGTRAEAVFHFPDAGRELYPGVFRARAVRAVYVDWKSGGQVNFLPKLGDEWWGRWRNSMMERIGPENLKDFAQRGIDFVVVKAEHAIPGLEPAYQNGRFVVYRLKHDELVRQGVVSPLLLAGVQRFGHLAERVAEVGGSPHLQHTAFQRAGELAHRVER
jgi:hypothetical protein